MQNRINKELQDLSNNPLEGCSISLQNDNFYHWIATLHGPDNSSYAGGRFLVSVILPENYPFRPPDVKFLTKIYHVNVKRDDGSLCADIFQNNWAPTLNMRYVLESIITVLAHPAPEHALENDIAAQMLNNPAAFHQTAQEWVRQFAK